MTGQQLIEELNKHSIVKSEIAMQQQLGMPFADKKKERLCISFRPHKVAYQNGKFLFYASQYELEFDYPSKHIVHFSNLTYKRSIDTSEPVCVIDSSVMLETGRYMLSKLYDELTELLEFWEKDKAVSDVAIKNYQRSYYAAAKKIGLEKLYGEG